MIARTLASNTGYDSQPTFQSAIDWLDITFRNITNETEAAEIISELEALTADSYDYSLTKAVFNGRSWSGSGASGRGGRLWYDDGSDSSGNLEDSRAQLKFSLPGKVMSTVEFPILADWLTFRAARNELDCTRIDLCIDDRDRIAEINQVVEARERGNFFNVSHTSIQKSSKRGQAEGVTIYFGHPSSHKRLRVYDKDIESNGATKGVRWEAQFRKQAARHILFEVLEKCDHSVETLVEFIRDCVTGLVDFRDRSGNDPNRARCKCLPWFEAFCNALKSNPIRIRIGTIQPLVQRSIDWIDKSVAQSLAVVKSVLGADFPAYLNSVLSDGYARLNNRKRELIKATDKQQLFYNYSAA